METTRTPMHRATHDELVVEELPDETLVYDLKHHKAHRRSSKKPSRSSAR